MLLDGFPVFVFPPFWSYDLCRSKMFCVLKSFWSTAWELRLSLAHFLWFWAFTQATRLEKHLREPIKTNLVITNAIFSDTSNNRTQSSADKLGHPIKFTEKMDGIWVYRFASHP